ncbi:MAG: glycoside hydrolase family 127 protein, partial [Clostridia bacterium]|nr:glycoside hydrolase family 127 protein [Clostridia bacterium]
MMNRALFNLPPLSKNSMAALPLGAIRPEGWLRKQLETAAEGLTGKLHEFWPDVKDSAWRGGAGDGWERAPYYLDGLVPLAWLLEDEKLKGVCMEYIEWTLQSQREDGFFGPADNEDWWPRMVMLKALMQYFTATVDKRVPEFMFNYFKYEYRAIDKKPLREWAVARGAENIQAVVWLYNLTGGKHKFLLELMQKLRDQTLDWTGHFSAFPHTQAMQRLIPWEEMKTGRAMEDEKGEKLAGGERPYYATQYHLSHVVNVAMGLKAPGVISQFKSGTKEREAFQAGWQKLMKHHGVAYGMFTGDEHLSGNGPTQGTETCAVVELMYTLETLLTCGVPEDGLGDILEKLAFNALPGAMSPDMLLHQYDQQANQVKCSAEKRDWYNNNQDSNLFGLEPNFGYCTANLHQGWPKFAESLWYATPDGGFAAVSYAPCAVRFRSGDVPVKLRVETAYPFGEKVLIHVDVAQPKAFPICLRIPQWADEATLRVNGGEDMAPVAGQYSVIEGEWRRGDVIELTLPMKPRLTGWSRRSAAVELGPLLMAFRPEETWTKVKEHPVAPDYAVTTREKWNWALVEGGELTAALAARDTAFGFG